MYILLDKNEVKEIIPDADPVFPGIPIEERYTADFVAGLLHISDGIEVNQNWIYDPETQTFSAPPEPEPLPEPEPEPEPEPGQPTLTERVAAIETAIEKGLSL